MRLTRHTLSHHAIRAPISNKNHPAMKFPPAPIISPSWKHLLESKCSSITPASGGSPHEDNFKPQPTVIPLNLHLLMHSCRQKKIKSKQTVSRRELCPRCTPDTRSLCPGALQHHGRGNVSFLTSLLPHHSFPPFSPVFFFKLHGLFLLQDPAQLKFWLFSRHPCTSQPAGRSSPGLSVFLSYLPSFLAS